MSNNTATFSELGIEDVLYEEAVRIVLNDKKPQHMHIQRKLRIGYQRASRLIEQMVDDGVISSYTGKRIILMDLQEFLDMREKRVKTILSSNKKTTS